MLYEQLIGMAMGMKTIDEDILKIAKENNIKVKFFRRYLDDIFMLFNDTCKNLHEFLHMIIQIHPSL